MDLLLSWLAMTSSRAPVAHCGSLLYWHTRGCLWALRKALHLGRTIFNQVQVRVPLKLYSDAWLAVLWQIFNGSSPLLCLYSAPAILLLIPSCQSMTSLLDSGASEITSCSTCLILCLDAIFFQQSHPHDCMKKLPQDFEGREMMNSSPLLPCCVCTD